MKTVANFDSKVFYRTVAALVIPMALQNLINVAVQSADVVMLGLVGEEVLAASSQAGQVQFVLTLLFFGISSGASVLTAQYWGKGDKRAIEKVFAIALRLSFIAALLFALAAFIIPARLMRIFSPNPEIIAYGAQYLRIVAISYMFMAFTNIYLNLMRSVEKVVVSTVVYFVSLVVNIGLNAFFIFGLNMGIVGAALATSIARAVEIVIVIIYAVKNKDIRLRLRDFTRWPRVLVKDFIKYALPTTLNELFWGMAIATNAIIIGNYPIEGVAVFAVAANSVAQVVRQLATVVCFGIANATAIMIGKAIGGGEPLKAQLYASKLLRLTLITGIVGSGVILVLRPFIVRAMDFDPIAKQYLGFLLLVMAVYVIAQSYNTTMIVGIFRGGGDTRFGFFLDVGVMWFGSLLWGALAAFVFKLPIEAVYVIIMCDEFIKVPLSTLRYRSKRWLRDVTRAGV